jgi:hypothetical protein
VYKIHINEKRWVGRLPVQGIQSGDLQLFDHDRRPQMVVDVCGSIEGFRILELGPLESAHTYQLERLGAGSILCTEASPEFRGAGDASGRTAWISLPLLRSVLSRL